MAWVQPLVLCAYPHLAPEYLRAFAEYRMIIFGAAMTLIMVFRPQGLVSPKPKSYEIDDKEVQENEARPNETSPQS